MQLKDVITLLISILAFVISSVATTISIIRGRNERQRAIRNQITDILSRIISTNLENIQYYHENEAKDPKYFAALSSALSQQNAFLLNQAMYLTDQVPELVTAVEYNTLAVANANAGDLIIAEKYYRKAIEVAKTDYFKALATRSYAMFLFSQRRFEEARELFNKALIAIGGSGNLARYQKGLTYQMWADNEFNNAGSSKRAEELIESAANEFKGIDNDAVRMKALYDLRTMIPPSNIQQNAPAEK